MEELLNNLFLTSLLTIVLSFGWLNFQLDDNDVSSAERTKETEKFITVVILASSIFVFVILALVLIWI